MINDGAKESRVGGDNYLLKYGHLKYDMTSPFNNKN